MAGLLTPAFGNRVLVVIGGVLGSGLVAVGVLGVVLFLVGVVLIALLLVGRALAVIGGVVL